MAASDPSTPREREPVRFLVFCASLRADSLNGRLARLAQATIEANDGIVDATKMPDFETPSYDADIQDVEGFPPGADRLRECIQTNDAFVISCPEYNASMPGLLKNTIDWVSRVSPQPFNGKHGLMLSASPSMAGGNRGSGRCASPSSISAHGSIPTCSLSRGRTRRSTRMGASPTRNCRNDSRATSLASWIWSRPASTIRGSRLAGSNTLASIPIRRLTESNSPGSRVARLELATLSDPQRRIRASSRSCKNPVGIRDVVEHRKHQRSVEAFVLERQALRVGLDRLESLGRGPREHFGRTIDDNRIPPLPFQGEGVVAGAAADVGEPTAGSTV